MPGAYLRVFEHTAFFTGAPVPRKLGPPFRGNWGPRLWNEGQSMSLKWQSSNESESGICMIIGPPWTVSGPPLAVPGPPADRTRAPADFYPPPTFADLSPKALAGLRPARALSIFFIFARGGPPGHVAASHTAFAVFAVWAVRPCVVLLSRTASPSPAVIALTVKIQIGRMTMIGQGMGEEVVFRRF